MISGLMMKMKTPFLSFFPFSLMRKICLECLEVKCNKKSGKPVGIGVSLNSCALHKVARVHFKSCWKISKGLRFSQSD